MSDNEENGGEHRGRSPGPPKLTLVSSGGEQSFDDQGEDGVGALRDVQQGSDEGAGLSSEDARGVVEKFEKLRVIEALLFASSEPISAEKLGAHLPEGDDVPALLVELRTFYEHRGINLVNVAGKWTFRTARDLSYLLRHHAVETRRLSKAALETLAIISYHQPVTRAEIEEIRGVTTSAGTLDILLETGWIRLRGRRRSPGRPVTYGTSEAFLLHFDLESIKDLPGLNELKGAGLLDSALPANFTMPAPTDVAALMPDELPLEDTEESEAEDDAQGSLEYGVDLSERENVGEEESTAGEESAGDEEDVAVNPEGEQGEDLPERGDGDKP